MSYRHFLRVQELLEILKVEELSPAEIIDLLFTRGLTEDDLENSEFDDDFLWFMGGYGTTYLFPDSPFLRTPRLEYYADGDSEVADEFDFLGMHLTDRP